ncbi:transcription factor MYB44-like protein [Tanacetum coccineum]
MDQIEGPWTPEEDKMLQNLVWECCTGETLRHIPGRWHDSCELRWLSLLQKDMDQIEEPAWSPEEDDMLLYLIWEHYLGEWLDIGKCIPGRSRESCRSRWFSLQKKDMDQIEEPAWSPEEDEKLINLVEKHGWGSWSRISTYIQDRSALSCWSRWVSDNSSFTPEEDKMLENLVEKHGREWSLVSKSIPGKSALSCMSRWDWTLKWKGIWLANEHRKTIFAKIHGARNGNLSHEVGGVSGHQAPSIGEMARDDISSQGTHSYSRDGSAPTWNDLNERDSSVVTDDDWK